jgi:hypothetical protein
MFLMTKNQPRRIIFGGPRQAKAACILLIVPPLNCWIYCLIKGLSKNKFDIDKMVCLRW